MLTLHRSIAVRFVASATVAFVTVTLATVSTASFADPPAGKGNANKANQSKDNTSQLITAGISLVAARQLALDTGAIGFTPLPPGIAKNLARGKPLPPGIASRNLPDSLLKGLPQYRGYQWSAAGADLVLIDVTPRVVADALVNALR